MCTENHGPKEKKTDGARWEEEIDDMYNNPEEKKDAEKEEEKEEE
jgi:hypothetical protein